MKTISPSHYNHFIFCLLVVALMLVPGSILKAQNPVNESTSSDVNLINGVSPVDTSVDESIIYQDASASGGTPFPQENQQDKKKPPRDLNHTIINWLSSPDPNQAKQGQWLQGLAFQHLPTLYFREKNITIPEDKVSVRIDSDASSIDRFYENNDLFNSIEYITIRIEKNYELSSQIDLSQMQSFNSLKYICFLCTFEICQGTDCEVAVIARMVKGLEDNPVLIFYNVSIPE